MKLTELEPQFMKRIDDTHWQDVSTISEADGIIFKCPKCFSKKGDFIGVHSVFCWRPRVPQTTHPVPGRWEFTGTGYDDLSLVAGSSSIKLTGDGCKWHGFIEGGAVRDA